MTIILKKDYKIYLYENVFTFGYPLGKDIECAPGKIVSISDKEFLHNCDTERGFSGSPIILASNSKVIGVHKEGIIDKNLNAGTLLGIIGEFTENKDNINIKKNKIFNAIDKMNIKIMQMKKSICIIETENNGGTGFLCLIEWSDKNLSIPALFTCQHVLNKTNFRTEIKLIFYDKEKTIKLDESRIIFSDREMDITCIKLKKNEYDINDYLRIDEHIYNEDEINRLFKNRKIYTISFPKGNQSITEGEFLKLKDNNNFYHNCFTAKGSSGAPILNSDNMKVIGIHIGEEKSYELNETKKLGTIIPKIIKQSAFNLHV